jgi:hypothetical protein
VQIEMSNTDKDALLQNNLEKTHYQDNPVNESLVPSIDQLIRVETTEKMLKNGTILFAFGRLEKLADNSFVISRSFNRDDPFILTKESRLALIDKMTSLQKRFFIGGVIGVFVGIVIGIYLYKKSRDKKKKGQ